MKVLLSRQEKKIRDNKFIIIHELKPFHLNGSYCIFTVIRNPIERLISCHLSLSNGHNLAKKNDKTLYYTAIFQLFDENYSLENFLRKIIKIPSFLANNHFRPMSDFLGINPKYVKFIDINRLEEQFEPIRKRYGLGELERIGETNEKQNIINALPKELIERIREKYKMDFELCEQIGIQ